MLTVSAGLHMSSISGSFVTTFQMDKTYIISEDIFPHQILGSCCINVLTVTISTPFIVDRLPTSEH
jgi:hypothetical protein